MIYGDRLRFRRPEHSDLEAFVSWLNDPEVRQGLSHYLPMSMAQEERWFEDMLKRPPREQVLCIEAKKGRGWTLIGNTGFFSFDDQVRSAEIGIMLGEKEQWGQGYGTEAMQLAHEFGFQILNLNRIWLRVYEDNPRAIHVYEKVGYQHEGRQRQMRFHNGQYLDVLLMGILRDEWLANDQD